ncbi:hypothetical protein HELRODRAFT_92149 [Helobdella robusta]|uniref:Tektin n=1 Tax=Helobdella robusta TaxID=6412 RepID=T1G8C3_HELRO|nr:hypothetical protein HELRODRAFT_92149 [Helobdella robusta]ESO09747.1 hypothetical protein HELRODRAFT_92149 [Helobdella robusta]
MSQKEAPRYSVNDWFTRSYTNWTNSERTRLTGRDVLESSIYLRNETNNRTKWDQTDSNSRLVDRVERLRTVKDVIQQKTEMINGEIDQLNESKELTERMQAWFYQVLQINLDNLVWREGRREIDLVVDEVEDELHKERMILDSIKTILQNKISELFEQLGIMKETRHKLSGYLQRKNLTLDIDINQYNLTETSPDISLKPDPTRVAENTWNIQQWEEVFCMLRELATATVHQSANMRNTVHNVRHAAANDVYSQNLLVLFALRKRIHDLNLAIKESQFQKKTLEEELANLEAETRCLDVTIARSVQSLKLAHTRLENRLYRTEEDLCRDDVQYGLDDEVNQLETTLASLKDKKCQAQQAMDSIERQMFRLKEDLDRKMLALRVDQQCMDSRKKLDKACHVEKSMADMEIYKCKLENDV